MEELKLEAKKLEVRDTKAGCARSFDADVGCAAANTCCGC